jgi:hypothetical protein
MLSTSSSSVINVVVSRHKRNVDFVERLTSVYPHLHFLVYDKETPANPYNVPLNKGNEASVYLKYICDHYDQLPEKTFFIHDEEFAWHHTGSIIDKFHEALNANVPYYNINDLAHWNKPNLISQTQYSMWMQWYAKYVEPYIPLAKLSCPQDLIYGHRGSAQFLVHKDCIRRLPLVFYQDLYVWILETNLSNYLSGRFLEWAWHIFFFLDW